MNAEPTTISLSDIPTQPLTWLWPGRIPLGKLTLLDGTPGSGTSLFALTLAACLSSGRPLPDGTHTTQSHVLLIAPHDDPADTLTPRLLAAGVDLSHILLLTSLADVMTDQVALANRPFSLVQDLDLLEASITAHHISLVIIDPLMTALRGPRLDQAHLFFSLAQLAQRTQCAILLLRSLQTKHPHALLSNTSGSPHLLAAIRSRLVLLPDAHDEHKRLLVTVRHPFSTKPITLIYQISANAQNIPILHWLGEQPNPASLARESAATFSAQRQAILRLLQESSTPRAARDIAEHIDYDYECVRKMLFRLLLEGELTAPSRGQYTLPNHPCLIVKQPASPALTGSPVSTPSASNPELHTPHVPNVSMLPTLESPMSHLPPSVPLPTSPSLNLDPHPNDFPAETNVPTIPSLEPSTAPDVPAPRCPLNPSAHPFDPSSNLPWHGSAPNHHAQDMPNTEHLF